jgi:hypothetical protein
MSDQLRWLQGWYASQCDGDWEHGCGIKIDTLDNPGWRLRIDLIDTDLEHHPFATREHQLQDDLDWWICKVENGRFNAAASPNNLVTVIDVFKSWVESCAGGPTT